MYNDFLEFETEEQLEIASKISQYVTVHNLEKDVA